MSGICAEFEMWNVEQAEKIRFVNKIELYILSLYILEIFQQMWMILSSDGLKLSFC